MKDTKITNISTFIAYAKPMKLEDLELLIEVLRAIKTRNFYKVVMICKDSNRLLLAVNIVKKVLGVSLIDAKTAVDAILQKNKTDEKEAIAEESIKDTMPKKFKYQHNITLTPLGKLLADKGEFDILADYYSKSFRSGLIKSLKERYQ